MFALMAEGENIRNFGEGSTHTTIYFPEIRVFHICLARLHASLTQCEKLRMGDRPSMLGHRAELNDILGRLL
jgi:type I restriction enzyme S subunit